jgi:hypothetical protein
MHEGFLAVDMFVMLQRGQHHRGVMKVGSVDDDGIELIGAFGESLAVIRDRPGARIFLHDLVQFPALDVAEAGKLHHGMVLQAPALHAADAADTDLKDAQLAVLVDLRAGERRERGEAHGECGAGFKETPPGDRGDWEGGLGGFHGKKR